MTQVNMDYELERIVDAYLGVDLELEVADAIVKDLKLMITAPKNCTVCDETLYWDSRASAYTDSEGLTNTQGVSSRGHLHHLEGIEYHFKDR